MGVKHVGVQGAIPPLFSSLNAHKPDIPRNQRRPPIRSDKVCPCAGPICAPKPGTGPAAEYVLGTCYNLINHRHFAAFRRPFVVLLFSKLPAHRLSIQVSVKKKGSPPDSSTVGPSGLSDPVTPHTRKYEYRCSMYILPESFSQFLAKPATLLYCSKHCGGMSLTTP